MNKEQIKEKKETLEATFIKANASKEEHLKAAREIEAELLRFQGEYRLLLELEKGLEDKKE